MFVYALHDGVIDDRFIAEVATAFADDVKRADATSVAGFVTRFTDAVFAVLAGGAFRHAYVAVTEVLARRAVGGSRAVAGGGAFFVATFAFILGAVESERRVI